MNEKDPSKQLGTLRIIVAALAMGMVTITLIMQFLPVEPNPSLGTLMMGIALGMAC
ncbi:MAG: hypothetical protein GXP29_15095, partial [Planctomycetes bacterium]|nr:hypothetical protein [Planctomycetota bacterium]